MSGLLDLPAPLFGAIDGLLAPLAGDAARLFAWGAAVGALSMAIHARCADQRALDAVRAALRATHRALAGYDGEPAGLRALAANAMRLSARHLRLNLRPAALAALPLLFVLPWASNRFGLAVPAAGADVTVCVEPPAAAQATRWTGVAAEAADAAGCTRIHWPAGEAALVDADGRPLVRLPQAAASGVVNPPGAWDVLVANPGGVLPPDSQVRSVRLAIAPRAYLPSGPGWLRGWEAAFAAGALLGALAAAWARAARRRASGQVE